MRRFSSACRLVFEMMNKKVWKQAEKTGKAATKLRQGMAAGEKARPFRWIEVDAQAV